MNSNELRNLTVKQLSISSFSNHALNWDRVVVQHLMPRPVLMTHFKVFNVSIPEVVRSLALEKDEMKEKRIK